MDKKIKISICSDFAELIPPFLANRQKDLETISNFLLKNNFDEIQRLGHNMKGSGGGYGFPTITDLGDKIERAAQNKDKTTIEALRVQLKTYLDCLEIVIYDDDDDEDE